MAVSLGFRTVLKGLLKAGYFFSFLSGNVEKGADWFASLA